MRGKSIFILLATGLVLGACGADFNSIGRRTSLPYDKQMAIHLDAQQRVVMVGRTGIYCAEPSPDAIAAYAQAAALGVSVTGQGAGSGAGASQSDVASIGLRTQSITLMRDALYRLCEASANQTVSSISATQLMARSQDLTAVVVAVEQLTGATVAAQAALTHTASASSEATAIGGADQLEAAEKNVEIKAAAHTRAKAELAEKEQAVKAQQVVVKDANDAAAADPQDQSLKNAADIEKIRLNTMMQEQKDAAERVANASKAESRAREVADKVATQGMSADTGASAGTTGSGQFSENKSPKGLNDNSAEKVAQSVENMVTTVLNKDYTGADCMLLLTNITNIQVNEKNGPLLENTLQQCATLLNAKIRAETNRYTASYVPIDTNSDADTSLIRAAIGINPALADRMNDYLAPRNLTVADVLTQGEQAAVAQELVQTFNLRP